MHLRIGNFNKIPVYLNIPSPLEWFRRLKYGALGIARVRYQFRFYDMLKAKHEDSIEIISKMPRRRARYFSYIIHDLKIIVEPFFLILPKKNKLFTLWHEHGHSILALTDGRGFDSPYYSLFEGLVSFYACCKLKLHFNEFMRIKNYSIKDNFQKKRKEDNCLLYENRFNGFYVSEILPHEEREEKDFVYTFYRSKDALMECYMASFNYFSYSDYQYFFDWNAFLAEIGWENDEERWKLINYTK